MMIRSTICFLSKIQYSIQLRSKFTFSLLCIAFIHSGAVQAIGFEINSTIATEFSTVWEERRIGEVESNNEGILTFTPSTLITRNGQNASLNLNLGVEHAIFTSSGTTRTTPQASVGTTYSFAGDAYVITAVARATRRIAGAGNVVDEIVSESNSNEIQYDLGLQQDLTKRLGVRSIGRLSYAFTNSQSTLRSDIGSRTQAVEIETDTVLSRDGTIGRFIGNYQHTVFDNDSTIYDGTVRAALSVPITTATRVEVQVGHEWYAIDEPIAAVDGEIWYLGLLWNPTRLINAELGYEERIFGGSPRASISYGGRRGEIGLSWTRDFLAFSRPSIIESMETGNEDSSELVTNDFENSDDLDSLSPFLGERQIINEEIALNLAFSTTRMDYTASVVFTRDEQLDLESTERETRLVQFGVTRTFGRSVEAGAELSFFETDDDALSDTTSGGEISLGVLWRF